MHIVMLKKDHFLKDNVYSLQDDQTDGLNLFWFSVFFHILFVS